MFLATKRNTNINLKLIAADILSLSLGISYSRRMQLTIRRSGRRETRWMWMQEFCGKFHRLREYAKSAVNEVALKANETTPVTRWFESEKRKKLKRKNDASLSHWIECVLRLRHFAVANCETNVHMCMCMYMYFDMTQQRAPKNANNFSR